MSLRRPPAAPGRFARLEWICNGPSPYNDFLFRALHASLGAALRVHYLDVGGSEHGAVVEAAPYAWRAVEGRYADRPLLRAALRRDTLLVLGGWSHPLYTELSVLARGRYAVWCDTPDPFRRRPAWVRAARGLVTRRMFRGARAVMGTGREALRVLRELGASPERLVDFPYYVPVPACPPPWPPAVPAITVLSVGRLVPIKAFEQVVEVAAALREHRPELALRFRIAGDGPERARLAARIAQLGLGDRVELLGWLDHAGVLAELERAHVLLHPARFEPFGVVVLEAMARGRVVVCSDRTMAGVDRIRPGVDGFLYPAEDRRALERVLGELAAAPERLPELGRRAHETAARHPVDDGIAVVRRLLGG